MKQVWVGALVLLTAGHGVLDAQEKEQRPKFENEVGWTWHLKPQPAGWESMSGDGLSMRLDELKDERLLFTLAHSVEANREAVKFRPVAFDAARRRFEFKSDSGGSSGDAALKAYLFDLKNLPRNQIKFIGIEKLTRENLRNVLAPAALRKLKESGVQALSFPRIGERYDFELTTIDGKKISSQELRGKVVLLDFWAKWCGPCMAKMPKLKETYQKLNGRSFEIVGLNHDWTLEVAQRTIAQQGLPWPNVLAPVDAELREHWMTATGTASLPRLLLLDREGILRADVSPQALEVEIEKLMNKP